MVLWKCSVGVIVVEMVSWKRSVGGVRELCDVCSTTLFNTHWTCFHCGFTVCIDCCSTALHCERTINNSEALDSKDLTCLTCQAGSRRWLNCTALGKTLHRPTDLTMTQIIPTDGKLLAATSQIYCFRLHVCVLFLQEHKKQFQLCRETFRLVLHWFSYHVILLLLVCVSFTIIGQPRNSVFIRRV